MRCSVSSLRLTSLASRSSPCRGVRHLDHERGDVVLAAAGVGQVDERLRDLVLGRLAEHAQDVGFLRVLAQAVAAQQEAVAREHVEVERVDLDAFVHADRARDGVLHVELGDLLGREPAALEQLVDQRVILRQLVHRAAAHQVHARVADVREEAAAAGDEQRDDASCPCRACPGRAGLRRRPPRMPSARRARAGAAPRRGRRRTPCSKRSITARSVASVSRKPCTARLLATSPAA